ncbi:DUF5320 domain-containing protein [Desulfocurvibacter africanus]|uniref:DUF5320 domain-containing protein n=1 Tax=Desulfocurvibacter africanus TaxID=873 RepID=UPI0030841A92
MRMPGFNGTGPLGNGPRTGRGLGRCMAGAGGGQMAGRGRGLGRQGVFAQDAGDVQGERIAALEAEIAALKSKLAQSEK